MNCDRYGSDFSALKSLTSINLSINVLYIIYRFSSIFKEVLVRLARWVIAATKKPLSFNQADSIKILLRSSGVLWIFHFLFGISSKTYVKMPPPFLFLPSI